MSKVRLILQARTNSQRLPGKVHLPVGGLPLFVLAAKRAANTGYPLVVATSDSSLDDSIASAAAGYDIPVYRGSLNDVHARYMGASADLADDSIIVRLTADNVFPDGHFIEEIVGFLIESQAAYVRTCSPDDGLPYGLSAEAFTVGALRSVASPLSDYDKEHVTPGISAVHGSKMFAGYAHMQKGYLRCTVDHFDDYRRISQVFQDVKKPIEMSWVDLVKKLDSQNASQTFMVPRTERDGSVYSKYILGSAQLGIPGYGQTNSAGQTSREEARQMIETAIAHGVTHLDTARAYGHAESVIGQAGEEPHLDFGVVTKVSFPNSCCQCEDRGHIRDHVEASLFRSLHGLKRTKVDVLMLHCWDQIPAPDSALWEAMRAMQDEGLAGALGASIYQPEHVREVSKLPRLTHLQIPYNILDRRWDAVITEHFKSKEEPTFVFARSVFLQGILLADAASWPSKEGFSALPFIRSLEELSNDLGRASRADLCIAYVNGTDFIDALVLGAETEDQVRDNLALIANPPLDPDERAKVEAVLPSAPHWLLNPAIWPTHHA